MKVHVVYLLIPTSNHNGVGSTLVVPNVVYLLIPTSNHNPKLFLQSDFRLYIF